MRDYWMPLLYLTVAWILLSETGCQEQAKAPDEMTKSVSVAVGLAPEITFDKVVHDFGEVSALKIYKYEFKFSNTGDALLRIAEVKKCCGSAVTLDKQELAPGESGVLKVAYNSGRGSGAVRRQLHVISNDPANPRVTLVIKAMIVAKVAYAPKRILLVLNEENAGCPKITLSSIDKQPFSIKTFRSTGNCITADVDRSVEATKFVLQPKVDLEKLQKRSVGSVAISLTHPEMDRVNIYFSTLLRFKTTPRSIILFNPEPKKPTVKKVTVVNNYNEQFGVESTSSEKGFVKVLSQEKTDKGYQFEVEITPPPPDDTGKFTDVLYVNLKGGQKLSIKCYGKYSSK